MASCRGMRPLAEVLYILPVALLAATRLSESAMAEDPQKHLRRCFNVIVRDMSAQWFTLGHNLGLQHNDIEGIQQQYLNNPDQCCRAVLEKWIRLQGTSATKQALLTTLKEMGRKDVADALEGISDTDYIEETFIHYNYLLQLLKGLDALASPGNSAMKVRGAIFFVCLSFALLSVAMSAKGRRTTEATETEELIIDDDESIDDNESIQDVPIPPEERQGPELVPLQGADEDGGVDTESLFGGSYNPAHYGDESSEFGASLDTVHKVPVEAGRNKRCSCM